MARRRQPGAPAPKRRSRKGCCVRLNWEGRRTKLSVPDSNEFEGSKASTGQLQWHHHDFDTINGQIVELAIEASQGLEVGSRFNHQPKQFQPTTYASWTDSRPKSPTAYSGHGKKHTENTLIFIDESRHLRLASTNPGGHGAKGPLAASKGIDLSSYLHKGSHHDSLAHNVRRKSDKSFMDVAELDIRPRQFATRPADHSRDVSSTTLFSCPSTADEPLTPVASVHDENAVHHSDLGFLRPSRSPQPWMSGIRGPHELAKQSGYLWEDADFYRFQEPVANCHMYSYELGALYGFDGGKMDEHLPQSAGDNASLLPHGACMTKESIVDFGGLAISRPKHNVARAVNSQYYDKMVPVPMPWTFELLSDV
ncbi:hypothetical protein E4U41_003223 [Claviceps citrina]|nr:hypothetical protein E4U41_003223 [Claviceps citrina]